MLKMQLIPAFMTKQTKISLQTLLGAGPLKNGSVGTLTLRLGNTLGPTSTDPFWRSHVARYAVRPLRTWAGCKRAKINSVKANTKTPLLLQSFE